MKKLFIITILILLTACASNQPKVVSPPDWYSNSPTNPDSIYFTGEDEKSEVFAVANALYQLALSKEARISSFEERTPSGSDSKYESMIEIAVDSKIGDISIQGIRSESRDSTTAVDLNTFSETYEILSPNFLIRSSVKETNDNIIAKDRSSTAQINQLISELNKFGIAVQLERKGNIYYCLISLAKSEASEIK
jgi:hypothetical protein